MGTSLDFLASILSATWGDTEIGDPLNQFIRLVHSVPGSVLDPTDTRSRVLPPKDLCVQCPPNTPTVK